MGLYPPEFVTELKRRVIVWFANVSTVAEARAAEAAGADVIVAQGAEAGGHRGSFDARGAERQQVGLFALVPPFLENGPGFLSGHRIRARRGASLTALTSGGAIPDNAVAVYT